MGDIPIGAPNSLARWLSENPPIIEDRMFPFGVYRFSNQWEKIDSWASYEDAEWSASPERGEVIIDERLWEDRGREQDMSYRTVKALAQERADRTGVRQAIIAYEMDGHTKHVWTPNPGPYAKIIEYVEPRNPLGTTIDVEA